MTFLVTFPVGGPLRNCYTTVEAPSELEARYLLMDDYGRTGWAGIYRMADKARVVDRHGLAFIPYGPINGFDYAAEGEAIS